MDREQVYARIRDMVSEAVKSETADIVKVLEGLDKTARGHLPRSSDVPAPQNTNPSSKAYEDDPGLVNGGIFRCMALGRKTLRSPVDVAKDVYGAGHPVTKAMEASTVSTGGALITGILSQDLIEALRATAVVEAANPMRVPLDQGTFTIPKITAGVTGGWVGESEDLPHSTPTTGDETLTAKKYAVSVAFSNDLLRYATPDTDAAIRRDTLRHFAAALDLAYLTGSGVQAQPRGLRNRNGINTFGANATVTLASVTDELGRAIQELQDDNVDITDAHWFFSNRTLRYLLTVRDSNGNYAFQPELLTGTLMQYRFSRTSQIVNNLGAGTDSYILFCNMPDVVVGMATGIEIAASEEAAYHDGTSVVAAFTRDQTVLRAIARTDLGLRHDESVCSITAVRYAA